MAPSTRRSARLSTSSTSPTSSPAKKGTKRKADASSASPSNKGSKKSKKVEQKTLEETMPDLEAKKDHGDDVDMKDVGDAKKAGELKNAPQSEEMKDVSKSKTVDGNVPKKDEGKAEQEDESKADAKTEDVSNGDANADDAVKSNKAEAGASNDLEPQHSQSESKSRDPEANGEAPDSKEESKEDLTENTGDVGKPVEPEATGEADESEESKKEPAQDGGKPAQEDSKAAEDTKSKTNGALVEEKHARDDKVASNIVEKGIIYFFIRGRVDTENPEGVQDLQRSFFVLRPIPTGAKLGDGAIDDSKSNRLFALPKKVFPVTGKDRFMAFVEKAKVSMSELKEDFFQGKDYQTKAGEDRHTPSVMPVGEGVYAITDDVGRSSHLAYMLTIPYEPGKLQDELGIKSKGSFVLSIKNPKNKGPANAQLPQPPDFPESIMQDFRGLAWMPVHKSEYLDYPNAQLLLIGESPEKFSGGEHEGKEKSPAEELEKLEEEDQIRVEALQGEDAVFKDLHIRKGEYDRVKTTW